MRRDEKKEEKRKIRVYELEEFIEESYTRGDDFGFDLSRCEDCKIRGVEFREISRLA